MRRFIGFCAVLASALCAAVEQPAPLLVFLPGGSGEGPPKPSGWEVAVVRGAAPNDNGMRGIEAAIAEAANRHAIDPLRTYLAGENQGAAAVFYAVSRRPDLWAAALALGGSPRLAIGTNRLFAANTELIPVLWIRDPQDRDAADLEAKLRSAGFNLEPPPAPGITEAQAFAWLGSHKRDDFPLKVDCETGSVEFGRCYWAEVTKIDPALRNDVLAATRVAPGSGAFLGLGGFGYKLEEPGPGVLVGFLPQSYSGPLKLGDRIVSIGGKEIRDAREYVDLMARASQEKPAGIIIQRGKERLRIETRIMLTKREEVETARVQAEFLSDTRELLVVSRGAAEIRLNLPAYWVPCPVNWNGNELGAANAPGCWLLADRRTAAAMPVAGSPRRRQSGVVNEV